MPPVFIQLKPYAGTPLRDLTEEPVGKTRIKSDPTEL